MSVLTLIQKKTKKAPKGPSMPPVTVPHFVPQSFPSQHPVPARLSRKLAALRQRFLLVRGSEKLAQCVTAALMLLTLQMFLDWLLDLPFLVRFVILCGDFTALYFFVRKQVLPLVLQPPNQEACALLVEKHWPRFRGRVIAAVQFAKPSPTRDSSALVQVLQEQADAGTASLDFGEIISTRPLVRRAGGALAVALLWICMMIAAYPGSVALLERVFLIPVKVPRKTEVICLSKDLVIPAGNSALLEAQARGVIPSHGRVTLVYDSGRIQEITIDRERDHPDRFSLKIDSVEESLKYTILLNDGTSGQYRVKTVPRPNVVSIECEQTYPAYTGLPPVKRTVGNLALLAGSRLNLKATANSTIVKASLKLVGVDKVIPLTISGPDGKDLAGGIDVPANGLTGFSVQLTNQAGITSGDETQYRIDLIPDRPPSIEITKPERLEELCTLQAKPDIVFTATDDFGVAKIALCYRIVQDQDAPALDANGNPPPPPAPQRVEMNMGTEHPLSMQRLYELNLAAVQPTLTEGTSVEYWLEAKDTNNVTGPGIGESEHHVIKVVSAMEKKAEIMERMLSALSNVQTTSEDEDKINKDLYQTIQGKPASK